jgi:hypothetical protein
MANCRASRVEARMNFLRFFASWRKGAGAPEGAIQAMGPPQQAHAAPPGATAKTGGAKTRGAKKPQAGAPRSAGAGTPSSAGKAARPAAPAAPATTHAAPAGAAASTPPAVPPGVFDQPIDVSELETLFKNGAPESAGATPLDHDALDKAEVRELFAGIAGQQAAPVKQFVFELKRSAAGKNWIEICRPVMTTLAQAAEALDLESEAREMREFLAALELAGEGEGRLVEPTAGELLLSAYERMIAAFPEAFELGEDSHRRDAIVLHALLQQIPEVGRVTFERLFGASVTSLESLLAATPRELAATTDIPLWLCEKICQKLDEYRAETARASGDGSRPTDRERLAQLLDELTRLQLAYERAAEFEWNDLGEAAAKRAARQERQVVALKIEVLLAEMGEIELVEKLQKLPFDLRIRTIELFLGRTQAPARAASGAPQER